MEEFIKAPYFLKWGDAIKMRVVAVNKNGFGCISEANTATFYVTQVPKQIEGLKMLERSGAGQHNQIGFSWDACNDGSSSPQCMYHLRVTKNGRPEGGVIQTTKTSFLKTLAHDDLGVDYSFCVSAANSCGESPKVCENQLVCGKPDHPQPICHYDGCAVRIDWYAPTAHGCPVNRYRLNIGGQEHTDCTSTFSNDFSCKIGMNELKNKYSYTVGSSIAITAEAKNSMGWSDISYGCDPEIFTFGPPNPVKVQTRKVDAHTIEVCMTHEQQYVRSFAETYYSIHWNAGY